MYKENKKCRICGNSNLIPILDLGVQILTGVFPANKDQKITSGPLELVKCQEDKDGCYCGLVQLKHSYDLDEMYGKNYGYRSGLNKSMINHLEKTVAKITQIVHLVPDDLIIDIGSNDATLLKAYPLSGLTLVGIDPTGKKFAKFYPDYIRLIPDFFSAKAVHKIFGEKKAKIITSIAMFYDLEDPIDFMRQVHDALADDGIWVFEQSYMPAMLKMNAYDTVCHEHLEYYRLKQIKWMADRVGFKIIDVEFNKINGGSFAVTVAKSNSSYKENIGLVDKILAEEEKVGLTSFTPYEQFKRRVCSHRNNLMEFIQEVKSKGENIFGYGASTKGNVLLQFCSMTPCDIPFIAEVNQDKFGCFTPGTLIPIISEEEARVMKPEYFMVLPWHFREGIIKKEYDYLKSGGKLLFPLPALEILSE